MNETLNTSNLATIFTPCRQCGSCCKHYRKITLQADEVIFIKKMGGHIGIDLSLNEIREKGIDQARAEAEKEGKIFMIHPDDKGCIFLERRNDKYYCKIYHYRPKACQGYRCNLVDDSMMTIIGEDAHFLLGQSAFGLPLDKE